jgi:hypothetical protein
MSHELIPRTDPAQPAVYQIRIQGHLSHHWAEWFDGMAISLEGNSDTLLTGSVIDQAALHGLLRKVRDLGMPLLSVTQVDPKQANKSAINADTGRA